MRQWWQRFTGSADLQDQLNELTVEIDSLNKLVAKQLIEQEAHRERVVLSLAKILHAIGQNPEELRDPEKFVAVANRYGL